MEIGIFNEGGISQSWRFQDYRRDYYKVRFADDSVIIAKTKDDMEIDIDK